MKSFSYVLIFIFVSLMIFPFVSADVLPVSPVQQNVEMEITNYCQTGDCTYTNLSSITFPNGTVGYFNVFMTKTENDFNYTYTPTELGPYGFKTCGDPGGVTICDSDTFKVTYNGDEVSTSQSVIYGILFIVFGFIFAMVMFFIHKLPSSNEKDEEGRILSISKLKYLRATFWFVEWMIFVGIIFLASNIAFAFLSGEMFAKILFAIYTICFSLTPLVVIVWMVWIFVKMYHDKEFQKILNRGFFPQGRNF